MTTILEDIVEVERRALERRKGDVGLPELERLAEAQRAPLNLAGALWGDSVRVIAEIKKASPVKGVLHNKLDPASLSRAYADNGAAAISVLTNGDHFQGSLQDMEQAHAVANPRGIPVLRKDFIFDPYQVHEARAYGADAILLIVSILTPPLLRELIEEARQLWMQCLVEVHDEEEVRIALDAGAEIVGINNRDLRTFDTDLEVTERLAPLVPAGKIVVSESGISSRQHIKRIKAAGAHAALVGEALLTASDPGAKLRELV